jgi:hypothetical protein
VYVDDLLLGATSCAFMGKVKEKLTSAFKMRDLGLASYILGIKVEQDRKRHHIWLSQKQYIETVLKQCGLTDSKLAQTPMVHNLKLTADDEGDNTTLHKIQINGWEVLYATIVGSLMYAMLGT